MVETLPHARVPAGGAAYRLIVRSYWSGSEPLSDSDAMRSHRSPQRFLVPVDHSEPSSEAVDVAMNLARSVNGTLTLLAVVPLAPQPAGSDGLPDLSAGFAEAGEQEVLDRLARERLDETAARIGDGLDVGTAIAWGPAGPAIIEEADEHGHDCVVVGMRREGPLGHLIHDHSVRHVLRHSPVPVLVVPATGAIDEG
jgi:nucleotide-binding universal stress UspA family protein